MAREPKPVPMKKTKASPVIKANRATMCEPGIRGPRETSVDVRKIDNGYIIRESSYGGKGGYKSSERFSEKPPTIQIAPTKK